MSVAETICPGNGCPRNEVIQLFMDRCWAGHESWGENHNTFCHSNLYAPYLRHKIFKRIIMHFVNTFFRYFYLSPTASLAPCFPSYFFLLWHFSRINLTFTRFLAHQSRGTTLQWYSISKVEWSLVPSLGSHFAVVSCSLVHSLSRSFFVVTLAWQGQNLCKSQSYCLWTGSCWCSDCFALPSDPTPSLPPATVCCCLAFWRCCLNYKLQHGEFHFSSFERGNILGNISCSRDLSSSAKMLHLLLPAGAYKYFKCMHFSARVPHYRHSSPPPTDDPRPPRIRL